MAQKDEDLFIGDDMSEKSCLNCELYYSKGTSYCDAHNIVVNLDKNQHLTFAKECPDYTLKATQTCKNCVHYRDKRCTLHKFDVEDPEYSATICAEFTPINTQKEMKKMTGKSCEDCKRYDPINDNYGKCRVDGERVHGDDSCDLHTPLNTQKNELTQKDPVNPTHYTQGKIECIDAIESALTPEEFRGFLKGNVFKYMWRHENKNGLQDVKKGEWYYKRLLKVLKDKDETD